MASFILNVEDSSPLFSYSPAGAWTDAPGGNSMVPSYSADSLHLTATQGATATISFNGTGISLFGANKPNYGTYTISVDGNVITNGNASSSNTTFVQLLGEATGLPSGSHTAVLTNTGEGTSLDIDKASLHDQIGAAGGSLLTTVIDDTNPQIQLSPSAGDWGLNNNTVFINSTLHFSSDPDASVSLNFSGDAVAIYGTVAPDHADLNVQIDGQSVNMTGGSGQVSRVCPQTVLFYANNLGSQPHTLVMTSLPNTNAPFLDLDAIFVFSSSSNGTITTTASGNSDRSGSQPTNTPGIHSAVKSSANPAAIGGAVVGSIMLIIFVLITLIVVRRRRQRARYDNPQLTPTLPLQGPDMRKSSLSAGLRSIALTPKRFTRLPKFFPASQTQNVPVSPISPTSDDAPLMQMPSIPPESHPRIPPREVFRYPVDDYVVEGSPLQDPFAASRQTRQRDDDSRFTVSDYTTYPSPSAVSERPLPPVPPVPPIPPIPEESHTRQPGDHLSRFTISDYISGDDTRSNAREPKDKRRPPQLDLTDGRPRNLF